MFLATSFFDIRSKLNSLPLLSKMVILLVSVLNPAPLSFNEFNTTISAFLFFNLASAYSRSLFVSKANPTKTCLVDFFSPRLFKTSFVFFNSITSCPFVFFYFIRRNFHRCIICHGCRHHSNIGSIELFYTSIIHLVSCIYPNGFNPVPG